MANILIADDSITDVEIIKSALSQTDHKIAVAKDGEEAVNMMKSARYDLLILDVIMPKKNGFQVCRDIKRDENLKKIPIIILTSKDQPSDKVWGERQGADEYLTKPFSTMELLFAVKKHLRQDKATS